MKVLVAVKRVVDYNVKVRLNAEGQPDTATAKMSMNPFDEIASETSMILSIVRYGWKNLDTVEN